MGLHNPLKHLLVFDTCRVSDIKLMTGDVKIYKGI